MNIIDLLLKLGECTNTKIEDGNSRIVFEDGEHVNIGTRYEQEWEWRPNNVSTLPYYVSVIKKINKI